MSDKVTFEETLEDDDWGLIVDNNGRLKGLFIPDGYEEDDIPDAVIQLCIQQFGIDPEEFFGDDDNEVTLH